jgi:hypothetical protein
MNASVILIREWEQQMSSSGCCGRIEGDMLGAGGARVFAERRAIMEAMGPLYRALKQAAGDRTEVMVVDPRNQISLLPHLFRDFWRYRTGLGAALTTLRDLSPQTVVVNGRIFARGCWPDPESLLRHLTALESHEDGPAKHSAA